MMNRKLYDSLRRVKDSNAGKAAKKLLKFLYEKLN